MLTIFTSKTPKLLFDPLYTMIFRSKVKEELCTFLKKCTKEKSLVINKKKWTPSPLTCMTKREAQKTLIAAQERKQTSKTGIKDWMFIFLGFGTGLRISEIAALKCKHIEFQNQDYPAVFVEDGKSFSSRRRVPLNDNLLKVILAYQKEKMAWGEGWDDDEPFLRSPRNHHYTRGALYIAFKRVIKLTNGIKRKERFHPHSMRYTFAVQVYKITKHDLEIVRELLGHSSIEVTRIYLSSFNPAKRKAVQGLYQ